MKTDTQNCTKTVQPNHEFETVQNSKLRKLKNECAKTAKTLMQPQHETHTKNNTKKQMKPT
jgi:hypothetical protein